MFWTFLRCGIDLQYFLSVHVCVCARMLQTDPFTAVYYAVGGVAHTAAALSAFFSFFLVFLRYLFVFVCEKQFTRAVKRNSCLCVLVKRSSFCLSSATHAARLQFEPEAMLDFMTRCEPEFVQHSHPRRFCKHRMLYEVTLMRTKYLEHQSAVCRGDRYRTKVAAGR